MDETIRCQINELIDECPSIVVCSIDEAGFPNAKAMFKMEHEGWKTFYFSTNTSSERIQQFLMNPRASLYFLGTSKVYGLMLVGEMAVLTDHDTKARFWSDGCEVYYPLGVDDPDYCILKFTARHGNYYYNLRKHLFEVEA